MDNKRFSLAEFEALFPNRFESREELLREYRSFLATFEQLDRATVPELSAREKTDIFRRSWQGRRRDRSWAWAWRSTFRRPAVAFAAGIVLGCTLMFLFLDGRREPMAPVFTGPAVAVDEPLTIEHVRGTQVYKGKLIEQLYPGIENPKIVLEKKQESSTPKRVLYGTLDNGGTYIAWNL